VNELWSTVGNKAQEWGSVAGSKAQEWGSVAGSKAQEWGSVAGTSVKNFGKKLSSKKCCVKDFFQREWTLAEKVLVVFCCILLGVVYGFLIAPVKKGVKIGSDNGNTYNEEGEWWLEDEEE